MKKIIIFFALTVYACHSFSQEKRKFITGNDVLTYSLSFLSGTAQGLEEAIKYHYNIGFKSAFPNANNQFWDPRISWTNKDNSNFPLASSLFAFTTDGYHLTRFVSRTSLIAAVAFSANDFKGLTKKEKFWMIAKKFTFSMISNRLGQWIMYDVICRERQK